MIVPTSLLTAFAAGIALGVAYLAALWATVKHLPNARHPAFWLLLSAAARIAILLFGFYWIMDGQWQRLLACLLGFLVARFAITGWVKATRPKGTQPS